MPDGARILVVEDEQIVAKDIQQTLLRLGYIVPETIDAADAAIEMVQEMRPDLVLIDIRLRGPIDGVVAAMIIRDRWDIPVVYLTAYADSATLERAKISEPFGYIVKPFNERDLHATVEMALYKHKLDRKLQESERRFRTLTSFAPVGIFQTDAEGNCLYVNERWCSMAGMSADEARGQGWSRAVHPGDRDRILHEWHEAAQTGCEFSGEYRFRTPQGEVTWLSGSAIAMRNDEGRVTGYLGTVTDITGRKKAEDSLRAVQSELQVVTDAMSVCVTRCSRDMKYLWASPHYADWIGLPAAEIIGRPLHKILGDEAFERLLPHFQRVLNGESVQYDDEINYRRTGRRWIKGFFTPTSSTSGDIDGWVAVIIDVTEHRRLEHALRESDRRKDEFLAMLAHELRNPLAPIKSSVAVLKLIPLEDKNVMNARDIIERQVGHMARLLDDLLDASRITVGKLELREEPVTLQQVIEIALETARPFIDAKRHSLRVSLPVEPIHVNLDPVRVAQVFSNLLNNAAKYTDQGGEIRLTADCQDDSVIVSVKDNGIGISAEMLPRIFDLFSQVGPALDRSEGGLGIGLSLAKGLIELQGGTIWAKSEGLGKGSELVVRLPIENELVAATSSDGHAHQDVTTSRKRRLLVVDNLRDSADSLSRLLRVIGHEVQTAYDGHEALRTAESLQPEVILLDIGMPTINGYDVCRSIRRQEWGKHAFVVALTGWGQDQDRRRTEEAGFDFHLVKPIDIAELTKLLDSIPG